LEGLVKDMAQSDLKLMQREKFLASAGHKILSQHE
jgi:hypothetical protein